MFQPDRPSSVFVTGGAGFIGSHAVDALVAAGRRVTVFDSLVSGNRAWIDRHRDYEGLRFVQGDIRDLDALIESIPGHDLVWHFASNGDIPGGTEDTRLDLENGLVGTRNVLEAMRSANIRDLLFSSTGAVYGDTQVFPTPETLGPLLPVSLYGAAKIAAEAFISAYCHLFGVRALIFRFGNVVGARMTRGAIHDFVLKLQQNPNELVILGDGNQSKNYFLAEECVEGMVYAYNNVALSAESPCRVINLGAAENVTVTTIASAVSKAMGSANAKWRFTGGKRGWPGDQARVMLDVGAMSQLGWTATHTSEEAVQIAVGRMVEQLANGPGSNRPAMREPAHEIVTTKIAVIGLWHLGSVTAAGFAHLGYKVVGADPDRPRIDGLARGVPPLFEPGLAEMISEGLAAGNLTFTSDIAEAASGASVVWIAFDTPLSNADEADLTPIEDAVRTVAPVLGSDTILVISSQVPVGTCRQLWREVERINPKARGGIAHLPENLRLGVAVGRFLHPDWIVIGADTADVAERIRELLRPIASQKITLDVSTAEMVKHAVNGYISTGISFANELGRLCDLEGVDGISVARSMRLDPRIGRMARVEPGLGFGGGTLARDLRALQSLGERHKAKVVLVDAVLEVNRKQNQWVQEMLQRLLPSVDGARIAVLGLTYTPGTSTLRRSVAIEVIRDLRSAGAHIAAFDPRADVSELDEVADFEIGADPYETATGCDAIVLMTPWPEFKELNFSKLFASVVRPLFLDPHNALDAEVLEAAGFQYAGIGRGQVARILGEAGGG